MSKNLTGKKIAIFVILILFVFGIVGVPKGFSRKAILESIKDQIHLGLDLKGGTHLILQVMVDDAVNSDTDNTMERLKGDLQSLNLPTATVEKPDPNGHPELLVVKGIPLDKGHDFSSMLDDKGYGREYDYKSGADNSWQIIMKPSVEADVKDRTVLQSIETIRGRVDQLGVSEPVIEEHGLGAYQILVQLPGVTDFDKVRENLQNTARLEFRLVSGGPFPNEQSAKDSLSGVVPSDRELLPGHNVGGNGENNVYIVSRVAAVGGQDVQDAQPSTDENGRPEATFSLSVEGGHKMEAFTQAHLKEPMAVVLNKHVIEVATIEDVIRDKGLIHGGLTEEQARNLSLMLRTGALPASIHFLEDQEVGPSLGKDSIHQGVLAAVIGMGAVLIFMLIYYRGAGINADLALIFNLIILLGFIGFFHNYAVLTLPGIAGIILTVGMGVDSNVLIFERIREELRAGKAPASAVDQGFSHAWITIIDTHVTTIVSAAILFIFGTGPVKGFAVTLTFGLLANLFTAVFVSRVIFDSSLSRKQRGEALSI